MPNITPRRLPSASFPIQDSSILQQSNTQQIQVMNAKGGRELFMHKVQLTTQVVTSTCVLHVLRPNLFSVRRNESSLFSTKHDGVAAIKIGTGKGVHVHTMQAWGGTGDGGLEAQLHPFLTLTLCSHKDRYRQRCPSMCTPCRHGGERGLEAQLHPFLTLTLCKGAWSVSRHARFTTRERTPILIQYAAGWVSKSV